MIEKIESGIIGVCIGDAVGVPVQFMSRSTIAQNPMTDMLGYGPFNMAPGT